MSLSEPKNYNKNKTCSNWTQRSQGRFKKNPKLLAIEECKRLYQKYYAYPSSSLLNQLNENSLSIFLDKLNYSDINVIKGLLLKFFHFQKIQISPADPIKQEPISQRKQYRPTPLTKAEKDQIERLNKIKEKNIRQMINKLIICMSKHLPLTKSLISFSLNGIDLAPKYCQLISKALINNKSVQILSIANCKISLNSYELLIESLLNHRLLEYLDLSNNNMEDKYGKMINRLIGRHSQLRDQIVWSYGLRGEAPLSKDYKKGLISINLNGNNLSSDAAEYISSALYSDQYIRAVYLSNNQMNKSSCKKFIYMMRKNLYLLTIDLRGNPGYDESIHTRLVMKMSKNIRFLYQQYKKGEYSEEEFENLKQFIDASFFDVDIPQNVVDFYNENLPENIEEVDQKDNNNIKIDSERNKNMSDIQEECEENENTNKNNINKNNNSDSNDKNFNIIDENQKLYDENLKLKRQIIELKAKNLRKQLIPDDNKNKNEESEESKTESINTEYKKVESLINELNELINKIEQKKSDKKAKNKTKKENNKNIINNDKNNTNNINNINIIQNKDIEKSNEIKEEDKNKEPEIKEIKEIKDKENINDKIDKKEKENSNEKIEEKEINKINEIKNDDKNELKSDMINKDDEDLKIIDNKNGVDDPLRRMLAEPTEEKDKDSDNSHLVDENGNVYNFDDLTDEEKMVIIQQQLILQRLQEEAEARGEEFDPQEYLELLQRQAEEEEEAQSSGKLNKSF